MTIEFLLDNPAALPPPLVRRRTQVLGEADLAAFGRRRLVVLSPHFDDACFSLGGFLARIGHGDLVNIFTQGDTIARPGGRGYDQQAVYRIRNGEDAAFAARCNLKRHDLGCEEPSLRRRRPSQLQHIDDDVAQIAQPILNRLEKLSDSFAPGERGVLLAPLGVGRHVNHRAVAQMVMTYLPVLQDRYDVHLYEDQPYAGKMLNRMLALRRAGRAVSLERRFAYPTRWFIKRMLVEFYPSQLKTLPRHNSYWPKALTPFEPHEAFWTIAPLAKEAA